MTPLLKTLKQVQEALGAAKSFIRNGIELGYIRMPDDDCPDTAKEVPGMVSEAITSLTALIAEIEKAKPMAWMLQYEGQCMGFLSYEEKGTIPVYTHPAPAIPEGWQQWVSEVCEYLNDSLETQGPLESIGSIDARKLLAASPEPKP